jgi:DNA helicase HerA-like ATPase
MEDLLTQTFLKLKRERQDWNLNDLLREMAKDGPTLELPFATSAPAISRVEHQIGRHDFIGAATDWEGLLRDNPVVDIDCALLDQSQLQLIATATLRDLFDRRLKGTIPPYVIVLEEAHLLVPEVEDSPCKQVIRENVRIGRHYGICVVLITQSPVDIDKKTIRQCNTRLIFALEPDQLDALQGVRSDATEDMLRRLPKMPLGTCLLSGTYQTIKHAIPVRIRSDRRTVAAGATPDILAEVEEKKAQ